MGLFMQGFAINYAYLAHFATEYLRKDAQELCNFCFGTYGMQTCLAL